MSSLRVGRFDLCPRMPPVQCRYPVNFGVARSENCTGSATKEVAEPDRCA
jgi:hypothetical protein